MTGSARIIVGGGGFFGIGAMPVTVSASEFDFCRTRAATE
jgi:hypothetical protein